MPGRKTCKFKSLPDASAIFRVSARRASPAFPECFLKLRQSSGLLWARLLPIALDSNDWKLRTSPDSVEEVVHVLQSRSVETRSAVCAARCRRDGGAGGASGAEEFRSAAAHLQDGRPERTSLRDGLGKSASDHG